MPTTKALQPRKLVKQARAAATRQRILDAAAHVFALHGYSAGTTNRIARAAHVSIGSLYQYFPNKDAILFELANAHLSAGIEITLRLFTEGPLPDALDELLRIFVRATIENHLGEPSLHRVLFEEAPRPPELLESLHAGEDWIVAAAEQLLAAHPEVGVADTATAARLAVSAIESLIHRNFAASHPVEVERFERELVDMLSRYLRGGDA